MPLLVFARKLAEKASEKRLATESQQADVDDVDLDMESEDLVRSLCCKRLLLCASSQPSSVREEGTGHKRSRLQGHDVRLLPTQKEEGTGGAEEDDEEHMQAEFADPDDSGDDVVDEFVLSDDDSASNDDIPPRKAKISSGKSGKSVKQLGNSVKSVKQSGKHGAKKHVGAKHDAKPSKRKSSKLAVKADAKVRKSRGKTKVRSRS